MRRSRYGVLMCVDMYMATKNVHASSISYRTFCRFTAQAIRAYLAILVSLLKLVVASPLQSFVDCNT